ncbi:MAG: hypothetical protein GY714_32180 [Desulfobacterales bacterium]|nr:hypothetical protein [Desulfobacterales bacterium]MCP4161238.1 hypothetical protein [Deltaproteobacteria bacterium]
MGITWWQGLFAQTGNIFYQARVAVEGILNNSLRDKSNIVIKTCKVKKGGAAFDLNTNTIEISNDNDEVGNIVEGILHEFYLHCLPELNNLRLSEEEEHSKIFVAGNNTMRSAIDKIIQEQGFKISKVLFDSYIEDIILCINGAPDGLEKWKESKNNILRGKNFESDSNSDSDFEI